MAAVAPGDVFRLSGGLFTVERGGGNALRAGRRGVLTRLGWFCHVAAETPNLSTVAFEVDAGTGLHAPAPGALPARAWHPPGSSGGG